MSEPLTICLVCPYALAGSHPVAEYVRNEATGLAGRGHRVTVLAPSASSRALRSGRARLRSLAAGDREALHALAGEPLAVAVGPAVPSGSRGRGTGLPVATSANVALVVGEGGFDIVHAHEPMVPGLATAALRHTRGMTVATFHSETERAVSYPIRGGRRRRYGARIDALLAVSPRAAELAEQLYAGDYQLMPDPISAQFQPAAKTAASVAAEWTSDGRAVSRALIRMVADRPDAELTLLWDRHGRRPMRPHVPARARGRVHTIGYRRRRRPRPAAGRHIGVRGGAGRQPAAGLGGPRIRVRGGVDRRSAGPSLRVRPAAAGRGRRRPRAR